MRPAAFFDLDKTLMAGSSGMQFGRVAYASGIVPRRRMLAWAVEHVRYRLRGSTDERTRQLLAQVEELLSGVPEQEVERMTPELLSRILPRIYPRMLEEVHEHQDAGRATFIISAAGHELVELLAEVLGMDGGIGTRYEVLPDHTLSGKIEGPFIYGEGKVEAMRDFAREHDLDLAESYAYSDSASDLPMLEAVGNPVAVNPDPELAAVAKREGWRILRFEKLGRRLVIAGAAVTAALAGGAGRAIAARRRPRRAALRRR